MESVIKWHTGTPDISGRYIITHSWGGITVDWYDKKLGWYKGFDKHVIAWCSVNDIEPYKE